jgi:hypothetical protein
METVSRKRAMREMRAPDLSPEELKRLGRTIVSAQLAAQK